MRTNPILVSLCLLLAFCSAPVAADSLKPAPARGSDPFAGILDRGTLKSASPGPIADIASERIAVILSNTTENDRDFVEVVQVETDETRKARMPPPFWDDVSALHTETLSKYQAKMDQLLGPDRPQAVEPATPATPTPGPPDGSDVSARLKKLDELLRQGLITPGEGEAKRKAILDQL